jgi:ariadne-1
VIDRFVNEQDLVQKLFKFDLGGPLPPTPELCPCCFCDSIEWISIVDCGHKVCLDCYQGYLESKVSDGPECVFAYCPDSKCNMIVPDALFQELLSPESLKKYKYFSCQTFVNLY